MRKIISSILSITILLVFCNINIVSAKSYTVYSQADKRWGSHPYGYKDKAGTQKTDIANGGCGLLSLTNAVAYMNGTFINPTILADYAISHHERTNGAGTNWSFYKTFAKENGKKYGFDCTTSSNSTSISELKKHVQKGNAVIAPSTTLSSNSGHIMTIVDYSEQNNKFLILDSYTSSNRFGRGVSSSWQTIGSDLKTGNGKVKFRGFIYLYNLGETKQPPSQPSINKVEARDITKNSIKITWNQADGATSYIVQGRRSDEDYKDLTTTSGNSFTHKGLKSNSKYYYKVIAKNSAGSKKSVTYEVHTAPETPAKPTAEPISDTQIKIDWTAVPGVTKYQVSFKKSSDKNADFKPIKNSETTKTTYTHKDLKPGTKYEYKIVAIKEANIGPEGKRVKHDYISAESVGKTKFTKISRPNNVLNEQNDSYIDLTWKAVNGNRSYVYNVYRDGGKEPIAKHLSATSYTDKSATSGKIHKYQIKAADKEDNYNEIAKTDVFYAGSKITKEINVIPDSATTMKITWDKPSSPIELKYIVKKWDTKKGEYVNLVETKSTSYTDKNLNAGTEYKYYIQVRDLADEYVTSTRSKTAVLNISPSKITVDKTAVSLTEGQTLKLNAAVIPNNSFDKSVTWTSSNNSIVSVSNGTITAKAAGSATVTAKTANNKTVSCAVTVVSQACSHTYGGWVVDIAPGCETEGSRHRVCSKCQEPETESMQATGHSYSEMRVIKEATCAEEGEKARVCSLCNAQTDNESISKTEHNFGEWNLESTLSCTAGGAETRNCKVCGFSESRTVEARDHDYTVTSETQPTLDSPGTRTYTCGVCQDSYTEDWVNVINAGTVRVAGGYAKAGETVTLPVTIEENPGMAGFLIKVNYDKNALTPTEITQGDLTESGTFSYNIEGDGEGGLYAAVTWFDANNIVSQNGTLFNLTFQVSGDAQDGSYAVWLDGTYVAEDMSDVAPGVLGNVVTVSDVIMGDVNQDSLINFDDSMLLAKYLVAGKNRQETMFTQRQRKAANLYNRKSEEINVNDGISLSQLIAGYELKEEKETKMLRLFSGARLSSTEESTSVTVEGFPGVAGESVYVPVDISGNTGIAGFNFKLSYDKEYLTPVSVMQEDLIEDGNFSSNVTEGTDNSELDYVNVQWNNADNMKEDGTLFIVEFKVSENAPLGRKLPVELSYGSEELSDMYLNSVSVDVTQGEIEVVEYGEDIVDIIDDDINGEKVYTISNMQMKAPDGTAIESIPANGDFDLEFDIESASEVFIPAQMFVAAYDRYNRPVFVRAEDITEEMLVGNKSKIHIDKIAKEIKSIKILIWSSVESMMPMSEIMTL